MRAALVLMLLLLPDVAAAKCLSKAEARERYATHLYWSVGINGRCWASSMAAARAAAKTPQPRQAAAPAQSRPMLQVVLPPPQEALEDNPQWAWVNAARTANREPEIAFLTYRLLDVRSVLPPPPAPRDNGTSFFIVLLSAAVSTAFWLLFARRYLRRLYPW
jgi:hypothetical protein